MLTGLCPYSRYTPLASGTRRRGDFSLSPFKFSRSAFLSLTNLPPFSSAPLWCPVLLACEVLFLPSTDLPNPCLVPWRRIFGGVGDGGRGGPGLDVIPTGLSAITTSLRLSRE